VGAVIDSSTAATRLAGWTSALRTLAPFNMGGGPRRQNLSPGGQPLEIDQRTNCWKRSVSENNEVLNRCYGVDHAPKADKPDF